MPEQVTLDEVWRLFKETDKKWKETDERFKETDKKCKEITEETNRQFRETDKKIKEVSTAIGNLGNRLGEFVEEMVKPSALKLFQQRGIKVEEIHQNIENSRIEKKHIEIDLLLVNSDDVVVIEVKSKPTISEVKEFINKLKEFKIFFIHYKDLNIYGAIAGMVIPKNVREYAIKNGLFVIVPEGDTMSIANDSEFKPKAW